MSSIDLDDLMKDEKTDAVEPEIIPTQVETKGGFNPKLNPQHPFKRLADRSPIPDTVWSRTD